MSLLIVDGIRFTPWTTDDEPKFEEYVKSYYKEIFGEKSIFFEKKKLTSLAGIVSIPDGFIINFSSRKWFIIEVEIKKHDPHTHIAQQISKFMTTIYQPNKKSIIESFYRFIKDDPYRELTVKDWIQSSEIYKFLTEVVERDPSIIVIIDEKTKELVEACNTFKFPTNIQEFRIFQREGIGINVYAVQFEPIITTKIEGLERKEKGESMVIKIETKDIDQKIENIKSEEVKNLLRNSLEQLKQKNCIIKPLEGLWMSVWFKGKRFMYIAARNRWFLCQVKKEAQWDTQRVTNKKEWDDFFNINIQPILIT